MGWVESQLSASTALNKILIAHVPPKSPERYSEQEISKLKDLVNTYNVDYFINGHNHGPGSSTFGVATTVTVGSPHHGSIWELVISDSGVSHKEIRF